ncbi:Phospholipid N-methyltransferase [Streptomyces sp. cf386]|uniref:class I SAM-dependent methyltransferase n=1 Tax=Streptomyces sp. cf386 TaxID=1761904 RepID=UPI0008884397|nr:methyltransferase domain-containing protein [Streptomyces sp. cf386]SDP22990.1 Phospholipid N-methyltransferase [Streptomyces sp. cf386]
MTTSTARRTARQCRLCRPSQEPNDYTLFLRRWVRSPARMGAIAPSSRHLAEAVCAPVPERGEPVVVELGAGTGPFTAEIQRRLGGRGRHLAVEIDPLLARRLRHRHPGAEVIQRDAVHLRHLLDDRGIEGADVVVSGLPWALFPTPTQHKLMDATAAVLAPAGAFTAFTYLHAVPLTPARRFRDLLADRFEEVVPSRTIWRNTPPAFVLHARRPRT